MVNLQGLSSCCSQTLIEERSEDAGSSEPSNPGKALRKEVDGVCWGSIGVSVPLGEDS